MYSSTVFYTLSRAHKPFTCVRVHQRAYPEQILNIKWNRVGPIMLRSSKHLNILIYDNK